MDQKRFVINLAVINRKFYILILTQNIKNYCVIL